MAERGVDRRELSLSLVPTENSESGEKPEFSGIGGRGVAGMLSSRVRSFLFLPADSVAGWIWNWRSSPCAIS